MMPPAPNWPPPPSNWLGPSSSVPMGVIPLTRERFYEHTMRREPSPPTTQGPADQPARTRRSFTYREAARLRRARARGSLAADTQLAPAALDPQARPAETLGPPAQTLGPPLQTNETHSVAMGAQHDAPARVDPARVDRPARPTRDEIRRLLSRRRDVLASRGQPAQVIRGRIGEDKTDTTRATCGTCYTSTERATTLPCGAVLCMRCTGLWAESFAGACLQQDNKPSGDASLTSRAAATSTSGASSPTESHDSALVLAKKPRSTPDTLAASTTPDDVTESADLSAPASKTPAAPASTSGIVAPCACGCGNPCALESLPLALQQTLKHRLTDGEVFRRAVAGATAEKTLDQKTCPKCAFPCSKITESSFVRGLSGGTENCNHITCPSCSTDLCFVCLQPYKNQTRMCKCPYADLRLVCQTSPSGGYTITQDAADKSYSIVVVDDDTGQSSEQSTASAAGPPPSSTMRDSDWTSTPMHTQFHPAIPTSVPLLPSPAPYCSAYTSWLFDLAPPETSPPLHPGQSPWRVASSATLHPTPSPLASLYHPSMLQFSPPTTSQPVFGQQPSPTLGSTAGHEAMNSMTMHSLHPVPLLSVTEARPPNRFPNPFARTDTRPDARMHVHVSRGIIKRAVTCNGDAPFKQVFACSTVLLCRDGKPPTSQTVPYRFRTRQEANGSDQLHALNASLLHPAHPNAYMQQASPAQPQHPSHPLWPQHRDEQGKKRLQVRIYLDSGDRVREIVSELVTEPVPAAAPPQPLPPPQPMPPPYVLPPFLDFLDHDFFDLI